MHCGAHLRRFSRAVLSLSGFATRHPGFVVWWRTRRERAAWWVALSALVMFFLFDASSSMWWGGFAVGLRYLLPMLPFCLYPIGWLIPLLVRHRGSPSLRLRWPCSLVQVWTEARGSRLSTGHAPPPADRVRLAPSGRRRCRTQCRHGHRPAWPLESAPLVTGLALLGGWSLLRSRAEMERAMKGTTVEAEYVRS